MQRKTVIILMLITPLLLSLSNHDVIFWNEEGDLPIKLEKGTAFAYDKPVRFLLSTDTINDEFKCNCVIYKGTYRYLTTFKKSKYMEFVRYTFNKCELESRLIKQSISKIGDSIERDSVIERCSETLLTLHRAYTIDEEIDDYSEKELIIFNDSLIQSIMNLESFSYESIPYNGKLSVPEFVR